MHLPTLSHRFAPDDGRVTDNRGRTQKAAGGAPGARPMEIGHTTGSHGTHDRKGGERGADGHAPGEWRREQEEHGSRERTKKEIYKYLRERREKKRR